VFEEFRQVWTADMDWRSGVGEWLRLGCGSRRDLLRSARARATKLGKVEGRAYEFLTHHYFSRVVRADFSRPVAYGSLP